MSQCLNIYVEQEEIQGSSKADKKCLFFSSHEAFCQPCVQLQDEVNRFHISRSLSDSSSIGWLEIYGPV